MFPGSWAMALLQGRPHGSVCKVITLARNGPGPVLGPYPGCPSRALSVLGQERKLSSWSITGNDKSADISCRDPLRQELAEGCHQQALGAAGLPSSSPAPPGRLRWAGVANTCLVP